MSQLATTTNASQQLQAMSNGVSIRTIDDVSRMSKMFSASGFFSDCNDAAKAGVKIMAGHELGIQPFAAMSGIHIIKGKASIGAGLMAAMLKGSQKYNYRVKTHTTQLCEIEILERIDGKMESAGVTGFSIDDAKRAGCQNLDKYARNMLFARAISNAVRFYAPDLFLGGASVYTPEELGATVNEEGEVIELPAEVLRPAPAMAPVVQKQIKSAAPTSPASAQINYFKKMTESTTADIKAICDRLDLPKSSAEMSEDQAIVLVGELLIEWAVEGRWIDREIASAMVCKSIEATNTDEDLWNDFTLRIEAFKAETGAVK
jgi:hypothetical protein